jgi:hypothetical protein
MEIYQSCKKVEIRPSNMVLWIRDLFDFYSHNNNHFSPTSTSNDDHLGAFKEYGQQEQPQPTSKEPPGTENNQHLGLKPHSHSNSNSNSNFPTDNFIGLDPTPKRQHQPSETEIPFVSQASQYLVQMAKECNILKENKQELLREIDLLDSKRDHAEDKLNKLVQKEKSAMGYITCFYSLKKVLGDSYAIDISDIKNLSKLIHDFKNHGYDALDFVRVQLRTVAQAGDKGQRNKKHRTSRAGGSPAQHSLVLAVPAKQP